MASKLGTNKTVKAGFWPWSAGQNIKTDLVVPDLLESGPCRSQIDVGREGLVGDGSLASSTLSP
jgi:hypothetical protein